MDVNDNACCLDDRVVWTFIASRLAPTMESGTSLQSGRLSGRLAFAFDFLAPSRGRVEAHGAGLERGHAEPQRGTERQGQEPLVTWGFSK
ncbi:hypothetical protein EKG40_25290 [Pseudomonas moorei]|nr:hypothetical protein EKG40_25290 [Pseudomonas moorei]